MEGDLIMKFLRILKLTILFCLFASDTFAYLDPGTGSLVIQMLIGALVVASLFFRGFWKRLKNIFGMFKRNRSSHTKADSLNATNTIRSPSESEASEITLSSKDSESS